MTDLTERQKASSCRHFNGIQNATCRAGVSYDALRQQVTGGARLPCLPQLSRYSTSIATVANCALFRYPTVEEIEQDDRESQAALTAYLTALDNGLCPHCGKPTAPERQVGRCVYGACGHRLYQGRLAKGKLGR